MKEFGKISLQKKYLKEKKIHNSSGREIR